MLIVCPHCGTSYQVSAESLGDSGRSVRCVNCMAVWFEAPRQPVLQPAQAETGPCDPSLIRPPLDDVVDIGGGQPAFDPSPAAALGRSAVERELAVTEGASDRFDAGALIQTDAPPIAPVREDAAAPDIDAAKDVESLAAIRARRQRIRRRKAWSGPGLPALICALVLLLGCLVAARQQVVRFLPQTASLYAAIRLPVNLRGLQFENIKTTREMHDGVPVLVIEGEIVGTTARIAEVPRLRLAVVNAAGREIYAWTARPSRSLLPPGEVLQFRSRLASPPADAGSVSVRFFNRRDAQAGMM